ncbi:hypothetical protein CASFOL_017965 [Castilleja foliolosa]|uniref:Uncharacterized protein n=1 Tax=Castilleja foliolosa TaxID=1961234 RepID=A0ABD3DB19_9LAMI
MKRLCGFWYTTAIVLQDEDDRFKLWWSSSEFRSRQIGWKDSLRPQARKENAILQIF